MPAAIPQSMRAVVLDDYLETIGDAISGLRIDELPVPRPRAGQVLVQIHAASCNPSDLLLLQGKYGALKKLPTVPGWEGAGTVVESGGGWLAGWLQGKRVACALQGDRGGTWAEYFVANARECVPLKSALPWEQAAGLIINPFTAVGLLETARKGGHRAAVHTAGASQLGRMLAVMADEVKYPLINVVRREEQVELLESRGSNYVLNSAHNDFPEQLKSLCDELRATIAFEAVAGKMTGTVLNKMPRGSTVYVYGALSEDACSNIDPVELIFRNKAIRGFYLGSWMRRRGVLGMLRTASRVQRMFIDGRIESVAQRRASLDDVQDALRQYVSKMTSGKVLIMPTREQGYRA
jgi:NADPH:quinone reductase-like Zn-dependent oxidoreductase